MTKNFSLKDFLFNEKKVKFLSLLIKDSAEKNNFKFNETKFEKGVLEKFPDLELKERISHISKNLEKFLPTDYRKSLKIILDSLPEELDPTKNDDDFGDFIFAPLGEFVTQNGLSQKHLKKSLLALGEITKRFSMEGSVRFFINRFPEETFLFMKRMSISKNYHQRRLASEGLRPKLPWCIGIDFDYKRPVKILDSLYYDKTRFVVRSVANHLNDISKINPDLVLEILEKWMRDGNQDEKEIEYLINHSLRTSVKKGHEKTMEFLGFSYNPKIKIKNFLIKNKKINIGKYLEFSFNIFSEGKENLIVDYKIIYPTKNLKKKSEKVFKIKKISLKKGEKILIEKKYLFREMTTKKLYSGKYEVQVQVNGKIFAEEKFDLDV